jgi:hypothetical protein
MIITAVTLKLNDSDYDHEHIRRTKKDLRLDSGAFLDKDLQPLQILDKSFCWSISSATGLAVGQVATSCEISSKPVPPDQRISSCLDRLGIRYHFTRFEDKPTIAQTFAATSEEKFGPILWVWQGMVHCSWRRFWYGIDKKEPESEDTFPSRRARLEWTLELLG